MILRLARFIHQIQIKKNNWDRKGGEKVNLEIREDSVLITGYVNAVERLSKPIRQIGRTSAFLEKIKAGVFKRALDRNDNVLVLLNHDRTRQLASTGDGTATLEEDNIGLKASVEIRDAETVQKARDGKLVGWSFGFRANAEETRNEGKDEIRTITDMDLVEVSILDDTKNPAYYGTLIEARDDETKPMEIRAEFFTEAEIEKEASDKHEKIYKEAEEKHKEIDREKEEAKMKVLADMIAKKVIEALQPTITVIPKEDERSIDYSALEERLSVLKK